MTAKKVTFPFEASASPVTWPGLRQILAIMELSPPTSDSFCGFLLVLSTMSPRAKCLMVDKAQNWV